MQLLLEAIKAKASQKDVNRLNKILKEQNGNLDKSYSKIKQLQKKLVLQEIKNQASKDELSDTKSWISFCIASDIPSPVFAEVSAYKTPLDNA